MISFETKRARDFGIEHFVCISVNPKEAMERPLAVDALEAMQKYLDRERVVAVGELGYNLINDLRRGGIFKADGYCGRKEHAHDSSSATQ